jgi:hypothetical protein
MHYKNLKDVTWKFFSTVSDRKQHKVDVQFSLSFAEVNCSVDFSWDSWVKEFRKALFYIFRLIPY